MYVTFFIGGSRGDECNEMLSIRQTREKNIADHYNIIALHEERLVGQMTGSGLLRTVNLI